MFIQAEVLYIMFGWIAACGATALEHTGRIINPGYHALCFKKADWQVRNLLPASEIGRVKLQGLQIGPVNGVFGGLVLKDFKGKGREILVFYV